MKKKTLMESCATAARAAAQSFSKSEGLGSFGPWTQSIKSAIQRCRTIEFHTTIEEWHDDWVRSHLSMGWSHSDQYDGSDMTHPYVIYWTCLTPEQQQVATIFYKTAKSVEQMLKALN